MSVEFNPNDYDPNPDRYLDPTIRDKLEGLTIADEGSREHRNNVRALLTEAEGHNGGDIQRTDEDLNFALAIARDRYAKAAAERGSGIWGFGFHGLKVHRTKRTLEKAEYAYRVAIDAAGVSAINALDDSGDLRGGPGAREEKIRKFGILGMLDGTGSGVTRHKSEARLLAEAVETHRLLKVGDIRRDDTSPTGYEDVTKGWKHRYNRVAAFWSELNVPAKIVVGVVIGAGATAAVVAMGAAAPVAATATMAIGVSRAALTARWNVKGRVKKEANYQTNESVAKIRNGHDRTTVVRPDALIKPTSTEAKKRAGRNTRRTTAAIIITGLSIHFGQEIQHGVDFALDHTRHGIDVLEHDVFGHGHPEKSASTSSGSASSGTTGRAPGSGQPVSPAGGKVVEINPNSSSTVYGAFENTPVNVHDWYNAMAAAEHAGVLHEHVIGGNPNIFYLTTSNGSTSHASVIDTILNYMPNGHFEDSLTHHMSGSELAAHNSQTFGNVIPFADQAAQHVNHAVSNIYPAHVVSVSPAQESQILSNVHARGAAAFPQGVNDYLRFANHYGGTNQTNVNAYYEAFNDALLQHKLALGLDQATNQYVVLAPAAHGHWNYATMAQIQSVLWEEVRQEGLKTAA